MLGPQYDPTADFPAVALIDGDKADGWTIFTYFRYIGG
jgi:hypothetical protein